MGTVAGPEVCLYSRSHLLPSRDILTTLEVPQLFQGITDGSGSPYLTFTVQAARFVAVVFYPPGYRGKAPDISLLLPLAACCLHREGTATPACVLQSSASILSICGGTTGIPQGVPRGSPASFGSELFP